MKVYAVVWGGTMIPSNNKEYVFIQEEEIDPVEGLAYQDRFVECLEHGVLTDAGRIHCLGHHGVRPELDFKLSELDAISAEKQKLQVIIDRCTAKLNLLNELNSSQIEQ